MKRIFIVGLLQVILVLVTALPPTVYAQGSGCSQEVVSPAGAPKYTVIKAIELTKAIPENTVPNSQAQGVVQTKTVTVEYPPGSVALLVGSPDGSGDTCDDDRVVLVSSAGLFYEHSYASPDKSQILSLAPVNVSGLFPQTDTSTYTVTITLYDDFPDRYSASPFWLVFVEPPTASFPPPAEVFPLVQPTREPTATNIPRPTPTPKPTATAKAVVILPTPTITPEVAEKVIIPVEPAVDDDWSPLTNLPWGLIGSGLALLVAVVIVKLWLEYTHPSMLGLLMTSDKDGQVIGEWELSEFGHKASIGWGAQFDINLQPDDEYSEDGLVGDLVGKVDGGVIFARRNEEKKVEVVWQKSTERALDQLEREIPLAHFPEQYLEIAGQEYVLRYEVRDWEMDDEVLVAEDEELLAEDEELLAEELAEDWL